MGFSIANYNLNFKPNFNMQTIHWFPPTWISNLGLLRLTTDFILRYQCNTVIISFTVMPFHIFYNGLHRKRGKQSHGKFSF